ncbi:MAG: hypothetical protein ACI8ZM_001911 [Crocinitomix sp.]|jgi:hypothetical protein
MRINLLILLFAIFNINGLSQNVKGTYIWPEYSNISVPEIFKNEPAFYINNVRTIDFTDGDGSHMVVFKRIYINSESAAEEFNKMEIYLSRDGFISVLAARTVKHAGNVILLSNDQIIETVSRETNKYGGRVTRRAQFLFPNVEIGDVLDIAYQIDYNVHLYSKLMYLEDDLPSMESKINLLNSSDLDLSIFPLNNMPGMNQSHIDGIPTISWKENNVSALRLDYLNALPPNHPSFTYMLWRGGQTFDYEAIYKIDEGNFPYNFNTAKSITKYFISNNIITGEEKIILQLQKIILYFENELTWNYTENTQYSSQTFDFLKKGKVDYVLFYRYITKFLTENNVHYEKGYTKSLLDGKFELGIISLEQITERFLLINDENDKPHFLFPPSVAGGFYYIDETPFYLEENQAICLSGKKGFMTEEFGIKISSTKAEINRHRAYVSLSIISGQKNNCTVDRKDVLSGHYSFLTRSSNGQNWLKELAISTNDDKLSPTAIDANYPYKVYYMQKDDTLNLLSHISDTLYWLDLQELLPIGIYDSEELTMPVGNYIVLPFKKENQITFYLNHEKTISLAEEESQISFSNQIGNLSSTVRQLSPESLMVEIKVQINERYIEGTEQIIALQDLFENYATIRQKKWIISLS